MNTEKFFRLIYQHTPPQELDTLLVAWGSIDRPTYFIITELLAHLGSIPQDEDVYFTPLVLTFPQRRKENVQGGSVVWVDVDAGRGFVEPLLPPTVVVQSGLGKHYYWALDNFYDADSIERCNKNLFACLGQQGGNEWNRSRVLRVPGSVNWKCNNPKYAEQYPGPVECKILEWHPEHSYSLADLAKLQPVEADYLCTPVYKGGEVDQSRRDWKLVTQLFKWGIQEYAVRQSLLFHSRKAQERPDDYVNLTLAKIREALNVDTTEPAATLQDQYANAELEPMAFLMSPEGNETGLAVRVFWPGHSIVMPATAKNFLNGRSVTEWFGKHNAANRIWTASDTKAKAYYNYLVARCPDVYQLEVQHAGRYDLDGKRVFVYDTDKALVWPQGTELGVFWKPEIRVENRLTLANQEISREDGEHLLRLIQQVQPAQVLQPALGWLLMTPFKTLLWESSALMPILLLFGFPGSGKSTFIGRVLMPLLGKFDRVGRFPKSVAADSTTFSVLGQATQTQSWPVWFGEFRPTNTGSVEFERILREVYDESFENRGRADLSIAQFQLVAPVVVDGEGPFTQTANIERTLAVQLMKDQVSPGTSYFEAFQELQLIPPMIFRQFAYTYLKWSLSKSADDLTTPLYQGLKMFQPHSNAARIANNFRVAWAGLDMLKLFVQEQGWQVDIVQDLGSFLAAMGNTHTEGLGVRSDADLLCEQVSHFWDKADVGTEYDPVRDILWFNLTKSRHTLKFSSNVNMLMIQLNQRRTTYLRGPERRAGEAEYWGIHVATAQALGLDVNRPYNPAAGPASMTLNPNGRGEY